MAKDSPRQLFIYQPGNKPKNYQLMIIKTSADNHPNIS